MTWPVVGGKTAALGEMLQKQSDKVVRVPHGFAIMVVTTARQVLQVEQQLAPVQSRTLTMTWSRSVFSLGDDACDGRLSLTGSIPVVRRLT
jgi:Pyruvate phosphate dikinase, AMP/ATP-binding domain